MFLALICSLPILDNLDVGRLLVHYDDIPSRRWLLPPLTGTLDLSLPDGIESVARQLVKLRICERFWRLDFTWWVLEDLRSIATLVNACSRTLKHICIRDAASTSKSHPLGF